MNSGPRWERAARRVLVDGVEVDFVHQDACACSARNLADFAQHAFRRQDAGRVVEVGDDDELRPGGDGAADLDRIHRKPALLAARKALQAGLEVQGGVEERSVGGLFDQHFVARFDQGRHREVVGHRGARGLHHAIRVHSVARRDGGLQRRVAVAVVPVDFELRPIDRQPGQRKRAYAAGGQVVAGAALGLGPVHVLRMLVSHRLQYQYTGMPANMMPRAIALLAGDAAIALPTMPAHASTNRPVV